MRRTLAKTATHVTRGLQTKNKRPLLEALHQSPHKTGSPNHRLSRSHGLPSAASVHSTASYTIGEKYRQEGANARRTKTLQQCNCEQRLLLLEINSRSSTPLTDSHVQHKCKQYRQLCCGEKHKIPRPGLLQSSPVRKQCWQCVELFRNSRGAASGTTVGGKMERPRCCGTF